MIDWSPPDYTNLNLVQLSAPEIKGHYSHWKSGKSKQQVVAYFDWLLGVIPEKIHLHHHAQGCAG